MSTKFSIRPAARKRPWICKRSPPCLIPPPLPTSLIATLSLSYLLPIPTTRHWSLTFLLHPDPLPPDYRVLSIDPPSEYEITFTFDPATGQALAWAYWRPTGPLFADGFFTGSTPLPPKILFESHTPTPPQPEWHAALIITG